jgi:hypothetical protein
MVKVKRSSIACPADILLFGYNFIKSPKNDWLFGETISSEYLVVYWLPMVTLTPVSAR